ncbi:hypothetical protein BJY24_007840 [Nocardia transvalensis]|uniref:Uncharacterized protein n=1 Tax=Nocardia transvalensis TaxID=37333 RepID=A0A7W9PNL8_9NOCA|nr:hypothetical protein [Nocardia transvalensis]MBB5918928.1 hypothetical protein [Nocardia transvalensis]
MNSNSCVLRVRRSPSTAGPLPHRYTDKWGNRQLVDCPDCRTPWAPDAVIPRDRLCRTCRTLRAFETPALIEIEE